MKEEFYTTKAIAEELDLRLLTNIHMLITSMEKEVDYLQVFNIEGDKITHTQEVPEYKKVYQLNKKYKDSKIFAIRTDEEKKSYWTILYAYEY